MIYDISQEVFSCAVYPGDPVPKQEWLCAAANGDLYNLTAFSMCAHNGTHVDAPFHFLEDGCSVEQMALEVFVGKCRVFRHEGDVSAADAQTMLRAAQDVKRILISGKATVTEAAAQVFAAGGLACWATKARP